jgi:hypothetical protein
MTHIQIAAKFKTVWFTARVLGKGNSIGTYELHFDPCASNDNDEEDTHPRTSPFAGVRDGRSGLAKGAAVIKELTGDFTWDSGQASYLGNEQFHLCYCIIDAESSKKIPR